MHYYRVTVVLALFSTAHLAGAATTEDRKEEPEFQADVYNELYEAHVKCDEELEQSRSEFIVEMFERNRGERISRELLRKLLVHNIEVAREELDKARKDRDRFISERMTDLETVQDSESKSNDRFRKRQEQLRLLDEKISARKRYVEVNLCVLSFLQSNRRLTEMPSNKSLHPPLDAARLALPLQADCVKRRVS